MNKLCQKTPPSSFGYKRALERHPELAGSVKDFERWLQAVEQWLVWIEDNIPDNVYASKSEALEALSVTPLGLELLERLNLDIYREGREDISRTEYAHARPNEAAPPAKVLRPQRYPNRKTCRRRCSDSNREERVSNLRGGKRTADSR